jgi:hypothetical protein
MTRILGMQPCGFLRNSIATQPLSPTATWNAAPRHHRTPTIATKKSPSAVDGNEVGQNKKHGPTAVFSTLTLFHNPAGLLLSVQTTAG